MLDPGWGFGLEQYLGKPLPSSFASDIEIGVRDTFHDRVSDARCVVTPVAGELDSYRLDLTVEVDGEFLELALSMTPSGVRRL
ncbi:hypothetical protein AKJ09_09860 [Labilithrix luteola]|uniref:Uncharacterized protein n=1 Tax=Labilithrix luteola TaxID=1391654 RepID=A0A0K1QBZ9_9BACT|nr:hypothetical protein AKJ09_09860 [Labilithrix luteola]